MCNCYHIVRGSIPKIRGLPTFSDLINSSSESLSIDKVDGCLLNLLTYWHEVIITIYIYMYVSKEIIDYYVVQ